MIEYAIFKGWSNEYGGRRSKWVKKSSPVFYSNRSFYEYHWYEHYGIGWFEKKLKSVAEK